MLMVSISSELHKVIIRLVFRCFHYNSEKIRLSCFPHSLIVTFLSLEERHVNPVINLKTHLMRTFGKYVSILYC